MASLTGSQVDVQDRQELYDFLDKLKLIKYYDLLCENDCYPLSVLRHVDDSTLKEWGVKTIPRKAIMRAIAKISRASIPSLDKTCLAPPPSGKIAAAQLQEDARVAGEMKAKIDEDAKIAAAQEAPEESFRSEKGEDKTVVKISDEYAEKRDSLLVRARHLAEAGQSKQANGWIETVDDEGITCYVKLETGEVRYNKPPRWVMAMAKLFNGNHNHNASAKRKF